MAKKPTEIISNTKDLLPITEIMESNPTFSRRQMLGIGGIAGLTALTGISTETIAQAQQRKPRIAVLASYWAFTRSHADWIVNNAEPN